MAGQRRGWCARVGLLILAFTMSGVVWLVFDVVISRTASMIAGTAALLFFALLCAVFPLVRRAD